MKKIMLLSSSKAFSLSTSTFSLSTPADNSEATLRSLLNELARLTIVTIVKRASSFNRDLRVAKI